MPEAAAKETPRTADEIQDTQVKRLTPEERKAADDAARKAKKEAEEEFHANRIKAGHEHNKSLAEKLYLGSREITIVRKTEPEDLGYSEDVATSVVAYVDTLQERVCNDADIRTTPVILHQ